MVQTYTSVAAMLVLVMVITAGAQSPPNCCCGGSAPYNNLYCSTGSHLTNCSYCTSPDNYAFYYYDLSYSNFYGLATCPPYSNHPTCTAYCESTDSTCMSCCTYCCGNTTATTTTTTTTTTTGPANPPNCCCGGSAPYNNPYCSTGSHLTNCSYCTSPDNYAFYYYDLSYSNFYGLANCPPYSNHPTCTAYCGSTVSHIRARLEYSSSLAPILPTPRPSTHHTLIRHSCPTAVVRSTSCNRHRQTQHSIRLLILKDPHKATSPTSPSWALAYITMPILLT